MLINRNIFYYNSTEMYSLYVEDIIVTVSGQAWSFSCPFGSINRFNSYL